MSRFLINKRKIGFCFLIFLTCVFFCMKMLFLTGVLLIGIALVVANRKIFIKAYNAMAAFTPQREICRYQTFVIGEACSLEFIHSQPGNKLIMTAPGRSLEASYQIILHTISALEKNGTCIIIDNGHRSKNQYTIFDVLYFNPITRKELGIEHLVRKAYYPLFFETCKSIKIVFGIVPRNYIETTCPHEELKNFCIKKNIKLIYYLQSRE